MKRVNTYAGGRQHVAQQQPHRLRHGALFPVSTECSHVCGEYGWGVVVPYNGGLAYGRRWRARADALAEAEEKRRQLERGGWLGRMDLTNLDRALGRLVWNLWSLECWDDFRNWLSLGLQPAKSIENRRALTT